MMLKFEKGGFMKINLIIPDDFLKLYSKYADIVNADSIENMLYDMFDDNLDGMFFDWFGFVPKEICDRQKYLDIIYSKIMSKKDPCILTSDESIVIL